MTDKTDKIVKRGDGDYRLIESDGEMDVLESVVTGARVAVLSQKADPKPDDKPADKPAEKSEPAKIETKPADQPKPAVKVEDKPAEQPKGPLRVEDKPAEMKPDAKPADQKPDTKPAEHANG